MAVPASLAAFFAVAVAVIVTPGPDTALTIRNTLAGGRRSGVMTALGVAIGQAAWTVAASAGVVVVLRTSQPAFEALRLAGTAYLVLLGLQSLRTAFARRGSTPRGVRRPARIAPARALRQGLISNLANPKMVAFFTSLLPQVVPGGHPTFPVLLACGLVFCAMTMTWLTAYSFVVERARRLFDRPRIQRALDALLGTVLVAFGARLATESR